MMSRLIPRHVCPFCNRSNFRTTGGYRQHVQFGPCRRAWLASVANFGAHELPHELRPAGDEHDTSIPMALPETPQKAGGTMHEFLDLDPREIDAVADNIFADLAQEEGESDSECGASDDDEPKVNKDESETSDTETEPSDTEEEDPMETEEEDILLGDPHTGIRDQYKEYARAKAGNTVGFTDEEAACIRLMDVLRKRKAPLNAYKEVMEWHLKEKGDIKQHESVKDSETYISRKTMLKKLRDRYNYKNKFPRKKKVKLPVSKSILHLTVHDAAAVIQGLLTDPRLEDAEFLFHDDKPLVPPPRHPKTISDLHTGQAYKDTYYHKTTKMTPGSRKQLLPLVLYIDGSAVSHFHDLELIPVMVSLGFWNRKTRMREEAWGILGYVEKQHVSGGAGRKIWADAHHMERQDGYSSDDASSACESLEGVGDDPRQDLHAQLDAILKGLNELIETGFLWDIKHKGVLYRDVHLIPFVPFIKCDTKEADDLCGKYQMRSGKVAQICRACKVPTSESNDHLHQCEHKKVADIKRLVAKADTDGLRQCSQSYLINAFHKVKFSKGNGRGIHGACPSDMLHAILLGLFKFIRDVWFKFIGGKPKELMNALSAEYSIFEGNRTRACPQ